MIAQLGAKGGNDSAKAGGVFIIRVAGDDIALVYDRQRVGEGFEVFGTDFPPLGGDGDDVTPLQCLPQCFEPKLEADENADGDPLENKRGDGTRISGTEMFHFASQREKFGFGLSMEDSAVMQCVGDVVDPLALFGNRGEDKEPMINNFQYFLDSMGSKFGRFFKMLIRKPAEAHLGGHDDRIFGRFFNKGAQALEIDFEGRIGFEAERDDATGFRSRQN